jgi:alpha-tubulin suppressor-like RCC1 family protein
MNISNLQIALHRAIETASRPLDYLFLAKTIQTLNVGQIRQVAAFDNLPDAAANQGVLVFVTADESIYWSTGTGWYPLVLDLQQQVWAWGLNNFRQLGDSCTINQSSPVSVVGDITNWCQVSTGKSYSLALKADGTAWTWGCNNEGQLGDGTIVDKSSPVQVVGISNWCQVSAGRYQSIALRADGTAWAWGRNNFGQLGNNCTTNRSSPVQVVGITNWCQVSASGFHSLAIRTDGTAWAWGAGFGGVLGNNCTTNRSSPVQVVGSISNWCQVSAGGLQSAALRTDGTAWTWGYNSSGQLGDGTIVNKSSPVQVAGCITNWCYISASGDHVLAVRANGTAWSWGSNSEGQLGDGTTVNKSSPVQVVGITNWCQVSAGRYHSIALRADGTAWAWGRNNFGQLGNNCTTNRSSPVQVVGGITDWCQVSTSFDHNLALRIVESSFT